jgi:4-hydroxy-4-methyl-2-oxoglutarate aldolase
MTTTPTDLPARALAASTPTLFEAAAKAGALPASIRPLAPHVRVAGPALPVRCAAGNNLWLHHGIAAAAPGEVLVVQVEGVAECAYWGDLMTIAAQQRGVAGLVVQGAVRDVQRILDLGFPVFCTGACLRGPSREALTDGASGAAVQIGGVTVSRGDFVVGDADGVIVLPAAQAAAIVTDAERREEREQALVARLRAGETTVQVFALPTPQAPQRR